MYEKAFLLRHYSFIKFLLKFNKMTLAKIILLYIYFTNFFYLNVFVYVTGQYCAYYNYAIVRHNVSEKEL